MPDNLAWNCTRSRKRCWRPPARLLGAETVLVGLRPKIAQPIIELGLDFRSPVTRRFAERRRKRHAPPACHQPARRRSVRSI